MKPHEQELVSRLCKLLAESESLGLTFTRGQAYISADYVAEQTRLRAEIDDVLRAARDVLAE